MRALLLGLLALTGCATPRDNVEDLIRRLGPSWHKLLFENPTRLLVFTYTGNGKVPSADTYRVDVYDENATLRSSTNSSSGWRVFAGSVKSYVDPAMGGPCFEVDVPVAVGPEPSWQIFALIDDRPALIRLTDRSRVYKRNQYEYPNHRAGPAFVLRCPEVLLQALQSTDPRRVLEVLVWLGGDHRSSTPPEPNLLYEGLDEFQSLRAAWEFPALKAQVEALTRHPHSWVAEAARQALAEKK